MVSSDVGGWFGTGEGIAIGLEVVPDHGSRRIGSIVMQRNLGLATAYSLTGRTA